jgi:hypothetical protein
MFDIIGDIHGFAETLKLLLDNLGYKNENGFYYHQNRKAIFVGDFIDRGKSIRETLNIVKSMTNNNSAFAIIGNHEYNALAYNTIDSKGRFLREHSSKNNHQHKQTILAFENRKDEWEKYLNWFKTLPLFLEFENFNVVHACWDSEKINLLKKINPENRISDKFLELTSIKNSVEFDIVETILKGKEILLPEEIKYKDKDGHLRDSIRYKWWSKTDNVSYRNISVNFEEQIPDIIVPKNILNGHKPYSENEKPVFFGHYWKTGNPEIQAHNVCCVDYSIAKCNKLTAYRYNGEQKLDNKNFVTVNCID